uniref:Antitoxin n=1 Tax=Globodera pallida TaxID=36090 RepID=A0A183BI49_GLOPA
MIKILSAKKKLDELVTKCHNDGMDAMKDVIILVRFEHEELDKTFCDKLEEDVEKDKKMVSTAYQDKIYTDDEMMDVTG